MNPERSLLRVEQLYEQALARPEGERAAWVRAVCGQESEVGEQVLELLSARARMGGFLRGPALDFAGQSFGPYRAVEEIGRGGMSVVLRGERVDGDFDKRVAIKVLLVQPTGTMGQAETQILAQLEHPNIARLLDAGRTSLGFRYIVMEYVEGRPLTAYCAGMPARLKLRLFVDVCQAVQYAHRALVVHRDLKPENILVTGEGQVKLLDFGIAKMLDPEAGSDQTRGIPAFSPNYASPEQLLGLPVTTGTDVYSLGVLLCELMGGQPPRLLAGLGLAEMVDAARCAVRELPLQGDLAEIARKALDIQPENRYESAGALARDVARYLDGKAVEARPPSFGYRAGRFIARHVYAVSAAAIAVTGLCAALGYAVVQERKAEVRFNQVRALARSVMFELHDAVIELPGSLAARKLIVDRSLHYLDALAADTSAGPEVELDLARGYLRLSEIEGKDYAGASLGRSGDAQRHALRAVEIGRRVAADHPGDRMAEQVLVDALDYATTSHTLRGDFPKAIELGEEAVRRAEALAQGPARSADDTVRLARLNKQLGDAYSRSERREKALPLFARNLELRQQLHAAQPDDASRQQRLAEAHQWLANEMWWRKDYAGSEQHTKEALRLDEARYARDPRRARANVATDALQLGVHAARGQRYEEAIGYMRRALELRRAMMEEDHRNAVAALRFAAAHNRLGNAYRDWGRYPEAIQHGQAALAVVRRVHRGDPHSATAGRELIFSLSDLALTYDRAARRAGACRLARETVAVAATMALTPQVRPPVEKMTALAAGCGEAQAP